MLDLLPVGAPCRSHIDLLTHSLPNSQGRKAILSDILSSVDSSKIERIAYVGPEPHITHKLVLGPAGCLSVAINVEKGDVIHLQDVRNPLLATQRGWRSVLVDNTPALPSRFEGSC